MTNKQLYNLVFENFVQAKRELIKEGYRKTSLDEVDFNEVFNKTKHKMLEEKVKSLQRENEMLRKKVSQRKGLKEAGTMSAAGQGGKFQGGGAGSETVGNLLNRLGATFGDKGSKAAIIADKLVKSGKLPNISNVKSQFINRLVDKLKTMPVNNAVRETMSELKSANWL
jgi:hypothetical protein